MPLERAARQMAVSVSVLVLLGACGGSSMPTTTETSTAPPPPTVTPTALPTPPTVYPTPGPWPTPAVVPSPAPGALPVGAGEVSMTPGPDGGLYVLVNGQGGGPEGSSRALIVLVDATGDVRPGWPVELVGWSCSPGRPEVPQWPPVATGDGSVLVVCSGDDDTAAAGHRVALGFDQAGTPLAGWPVDLSGGNVDARAGLVDGTLVVVAWEGVDQVTALPGRFWQTRISPDGEARAGADLPYPNLYVDTQQIGPDGTAYLRLVGDPGNTVLDPASLASLIAFDMSGVRDGWPVQLQGVSAPAFGPDGRIYLAQDTPDGSRILVVDAGGQVVVTSDTVPIRSARMWDGAGPAGVAPGPPIVGDDGTAYLVAGSDGPATAYGFDPAGKVVPGWPYRADAGLQWQESGGGPQTGGGDRRTSPAVGPDNVLYLLLEARDSTVGGSLVAIGPDGRVLAGWPVELPDPGAMFWSVLPGRDGVVHAVTVDPATGTSVVAIEPDGTIRYRVGVTEQGG